MQPLPQVSPTLEYFRIEGLHGRQNVAFSMSGPVGIFIADNGSGKTTALYMLQSILKNDFHKLAKFRYERVSIKFHGTDAFSISPKDFDEHKAVMTLRNTMRRSHLTPNQLFKAAKLAKEMPTTRLREDISFTNLARSVAMPLSIFAEQLRRVDFDQYQTASDFEAFAEGSPIIKLRDYLTSNFVHSVLYLPTYRRVEQDLEELIQVEEEEEGYNNITPVDIHFGMKDVENRINMATKQIRDHFVEAYGQVSGQMLGQLVENTPVSDSMKARLLDKSSIKLVLGRVAEYVTPDQRSLILKLSDENRLLQNGHLSFFLSSLIEAYEQVREVDTALQKFAGVCNGYLLNKEMRYDGLNATVAIYETIGGSKLDLQTLSSGEKQILGVMSELYLGENASYVVIFDEPELSLSMDWQKKILVDVAASDKTFLLIAVTHSPFVFENDLDSCASSLKVEFKMSSEAV